MSLSHKYAMLQKLYCILARMGLTVKDAIQKNIDATINAIKYENKKADELDKKVNSQTKIKDPLYIPKPKSKN